MVPGIRNEKAFTLLEVLLAAAVLTGGLALIVPGFFRSADAARHIGNRIRVLRVMDQSEWRVREYLSQRPDTGSYSLEERHDTGFPVTVTTQLSLKDGFSGLYRLQSGPCYR